VRSVLDKGLFENLIDLLVRETELLTSAKSIILMRETNEHDAEGSFEDISNIFDKMHQVAAEKTYLVLQIWKVRGRHIHSITRK
jgi:hypothetical protein